MSRSKMNRRKNARKTARVTASEIQQLEQRALPTGTVAIALQGNNLTITGDSGNNDIKITVNDQTGVTAQGFVDTVNNDKPVNLTKLTFGGHTYKKGEVVTLVSPENLATAAGVLGNLTVKMGAGNDKIELDVSGLSTLKINGKVNVELGSGNDAAYANFNKTNFQATGGVTVKGEAGDDYVGFNAHGGSGSGDGSSFDANLTVDTGTGSDAVGLRWSNVTVKQDVSVTTGNGADQVYQGFNGSTNFNKNVTVNTGSGNDRFYEGFNGDTTFDKNVALDTGTGTDRVGLIISSGNSVIVKGNLSVDSGADNDYVNFNGSSGASLGVFGDLTIKTGAGDDGVGLNLTSLTIGDASAANPAAKNLNIETGDDSDYVNIYGELTTTGGVNIATGADADYVYLRLQSSGQGAPSVLSYPTNVIAKNLTIDTANSLAKLGTSNSTDDADDVYVGFNSDFDVKGNIDIRTFDGGDIVQVVSRGTSSGTGSSSGSGSGEVPHVTTIGGDLKIDSGDGSDLVTVTSQDGAYLLVKGNFAVNLDGLVADAPDGEDCLVAGDQAAIDTSLEQDVGRAGNFTVNKDVTINAGRGDDAIGLAGITIGTLNADDVLTGGSLKIDANDGDDVVAGFGLQIGGELNVKGGKGNDSIAGSGSEDYLFQVNGKTTIDAGEGNDTVLVDNVTLNGNVSVVLGLGNDKAAASNVTAGPNVTSAVIDGGPGLTANSLGNDLGVSENIPDGLVIKNFEGELSTEDITSAHEDISAALLGCLDTLDWYND